MEKREMNGVSILLATYNGAEFLEQQLDSLFGQTQNAFTLYVRDDCSTDGTWAILEQYRDRYPKQMRISCSPRNSGSAKHNFFHLMTAVRDGYIFLCDQDDVWLPGKMEDSLEKIRDMEQSCGEDTPILVHTDLTVVDRALNVLFPSFMAVMEAERATAVHFRRMLVMNRVTGCTVVYNRALAELLTTEPAYCIMHDWWLFLVAGAFGKVGRLNGQTILYRQHGKNSIGAKNVRSLRYKFGRLLNGADIRRALDETYAQAAMFLKMYEDRLDEKSLSLLERYSDIPNRNKLQRVCAVLKYGTLKCGAARKIAQVLFI
jgi:glycosyltransferase involved in cell wall biosynthesis